MQDATPTPRALSSLAKLTGPDLLRQLWPVALRIARLVAQFRRGGLSPTRMFQFEVDIQRLLREVGRLIVQWTVNHLESQQRAEMPSLCIWDGEYYRRGGSSPRRNLNCLFGKIAFRRFWYQRLETAGRCVFPLEIHLGIVAGVATPALADAVARLSADLTQRQVLDQLRPWGIAWGVQTLRNVAEAMASAMGEHRHEAQVVQVLKWLAKAAAGKGPRRFALSVGRDGVMVPVVKNQAYREAATATVSVMDGWGRRLGTVYLGEMPEEGQKALSQALTQLLSDVLARWDGSLPRLVYVTDCGHHPTEYFESVLSVMRNPRRPDELLSWEWIVDYYHACLYITKMAEAIFGPGRAAFAWAAKQRRVLKDKPGGVFRVLRSAGALIAIRGLDGSAEDSYFTAYAFLRNRVSKMDYVSYRRLRLPIGSGVTEAACKTVFTQRFKQSGMKWTIEGGRPIVTLRVISLSGIWDEVRQAALYSAPTIAPATPTRSTLRPEKMSREIAM
jgi:hypothetical protein